MNQSLAVSSIYLDYGLIFRTSTINPTAIYDVVKQCCVFSLQHCTSKSGSTLNPTFVT